MPSNMNSSSSIASYRHNRYNYIALFIVSFLYLIGIFLIAIADYNFYTKLYIAAALLFGYTLFGLFLYPRQKGGSDSISLPGDRERQSETSNRQSLFSPEVEEKLNGLEELNTIFSTSLRPTDLFRLTANRISEIIPNAATVVYLAEEGGETFKCAHSFGAEAGNFSNYQVSVKDGLAGIVYVNKESMVDESLIMERKAIPLELLSKLDSAVAAPLKHDGEPYGVLMLYSNKGEGYDESTARILSAIGERISPFFHSSLTFEQNINGALIDSVTNLPNEKAFYLVLENQMAETHRSKEQRPLTLLSIDIRGFADLNSKYGHATGDQILAFAAKNIRDQLRQMDFLSRISGDEFAAVLPTASEKTAGIVIERIRKAFSGISFNVSKGEEIHIGLNLGSASFVRDLTTSEDLLAEARAKKMKTTSDKTGSIILFPKEMIN